MLVKNTNKALPLQNPQMLSVFGYSANSPAIFAPSSGVIGTYRWEFGAEPTSPEYVIDGFDTDWDVKFPVIAKNGTMISGGGSGATTPAVFLAPFEALKAQAFNDGTALFYDFISAEPLVDPNSDACLVFGNAWASEGSDRPALRDDYTDGMIKAVADQCSKTIVIFHNAGPRLVDQFVDHPNVSAILFAHLPGEASGAALVDLLYGQVNPSGKLPYTVPRNESDYGHLLDPAKPEGEYKYFPQSNFSEGVYIDYRRFDKLNMTPRYEFGFGLSYTTFNFSDIVVDTVQGADVGEWPTAAVAPGGQADLWDAVAIVSATLGNDGPVAGAEVAQLYVGIPDAPVKQLRGFEKRFLQPGASTTVTFQLTRRDMSVWDTVAQKWRLQRGEYKVYVGNSSRQLPLEGSLKL